MTDTQKRKPGRPRIHAATVARLTIYFDAQMLAQAKALGDGSVQGGVRKALLQVSADSDSKSYELPDATAPATGEPSLD